VLHLIGVLDLKLPLDAALSQPRFHHQWAPDEIRLEKSMPEAIKAALRAKGHQLDEVESIGAAQIVGRAVPGTGFVGASEPRVAGLALGF
jgi:gamma-glutamyltranspeptidase/glutathione hydrolase